MSDAAKQRRAAPSQDGAPRGDEPFDRAEFHGVPVTLTVRLAEGALLLGELTRLEPGFVVPLETPVGEPSRLLAENAPIASGELVEIKGRLEFRVTRLGGGRG